MTTTQAHLVARSSNGRLERCFTLAKDAHDWISNQSKYLGLKVYRCECTRNIKPQDSSKGAK